MEALKTDFTYEFNSGKSREAIYRLLLNINDWWTGIFDEQIEGNSAQLKDVFSFNAGADVHYSEHELIELVPNEKIMWKTINSALSFISKKDEWNDTKLRFELSNHGDLTKVKFIHHGLTPQLECYENCSAAWTQYMKNLEAKLA